MKTPTFLAIALLTVPFAGVALNAQTVTPSSVTPSSLTFTTVLNGPNPASQQLTLTESNSQFATPNWVATVTVNTPSGTNWLSIDNSSGMGNGVINVSVSAAGLPLGSWNGSVAVQYGSEPSIIVPITLNIVGVLTFNASAGTNPPTQTLALSVQSSGTFTATWTATVSTSSGGNWLVISTATASGGTASASGNSSLTGSSNRLTVAPNVTGLAVGTYNGVISITGVNSPITTDVTLVVTTPVLTLAPTSLTFGGTYGGANPAPQTVTVTAANPWTAMATTTTGGSWLSLSQTSGNGNGSFNAIVSLAGLSTGTYQGSISVAVGSNNPIALSVTLNVAGPTVAATPTLLTFTQVEGTTAPAQSVQLAATPSVSSWLSSASVANSNVNWLSATPGAGGFPASLLVFPNSLAANLTAGSYTGTITISDSNASSSTAMVTVSVVLNVTAAPAGGLIVSPALLTPQTLQGVNPASASIAIGNSGSGALNWTASFTTLNGGNWLNVSPASGTAGLHTPSSAQVTFSAANLKAGIYTGQISIASGTATPQVVTVLLTVSPAGPLLLLGQAGITFNATAGLSATLTGSVTAANPGSASEFLYTTVVSGSPWLTVTSGNPFPVASGGLGSVGLAVNTAGLTKAGSYYGLVQVTQGGTPTTLPAQYICVLLNLGSQPVISIYPVGMILTPNQLQSSFTVSSNTTGTNTMTVTSKTVTGGNWLTANPATATLNPSQASMISSTVVVSATAGSLPTTPGVYQGVVTSSFSNGAPSQDVGVYLVIPSTSGSQVESAHAPAGVTCTPVQVIMAVRALGSNFNSTVGWPVNLEAQLVDNCANPITNGTVLATFSTGDTPLALGNLGGGIYSATWNPTNANPATVTIQGLDAPLAPATVTVPGTVAANATPPPMVASGGVVNAASFAPNADVTPGGIVSVFGANLAGSNGNSNSGFPLPTLLGGIKLSMGGIDMPLFYSGTGQVNAQVPAELQANTQAAVEARAINGTTEADAVPVTVSLGAAHPGIFISGETGAPNQGAILNAANQLVDSKNPASVGSVIVIYCTGLGATTPFVATGAAAPASTTLNVPVSLTIGGVSAPSVAYAGLSPGFVGLYQINVTIPASVTVGPTVPVVITQNGVASNMATIAMH